MLYGIRAGETHTAQAGRNHALVSVEVSADAYEVCLNGVRYNLALDGREALVLWHNGSAQTAGLLHDAERYGAWLVNGDVKPPVWDKGTEVRSASGGADILAFVGVLPPQGLVFVRHGYKRLGITILVWFIPGQEPREERLPGARARLAAATPARDPS